MKTIKNLLFLGSICMALSGCGKSDQYKYDMVIKNMANAKSFFIGTKAASSGKSRARNNVNEEALFMLTDDGYVEEVNCTFVDCKNGVCKPKKEKQIKTPRCIFDVNDEFMMICFAWYPTSQTFDDFNYLVNKETGRCYRMPCTFVPYFSVSNLYETANDIPTREMFITDAEGSIYLMTEAYAGGSSYSQPIKKLNVSNPDNITSENVSLKNDNFNYYYMPAVSGTGEVAYSAFNNSTLVARYIKKDGSFLNLDVHKSGFSTDFWTGYDGYIYCGKDIENGRRIVCKIVENEGVIQYEEYGSLFAALGTADYPNSHGRFGRVYLDSQKKILAFEDKSIIELYNGQTNTTAEITYESLGLKEQKRHSSSNEFVYIYGTDSSNNNVLVRLDPKDGYSKTILMSNKYDLTSLVANKDDTLTFSGLRFSDGAYVVGTIDKDGKETIADIILDKQVESLVNL